MANKTITMHDQRYFHLACGHSVVLGRLQNADTWQCEEKGCAVITNLCDEPHKRRLARERDTADELDKQARARGEIVVRALAI